ncbi:hypothetical protein Tsp_07525 [Trichinella spiralis]|uniref:hypothetical protein n=1 Tax=Trichinella spiralis TaxID=6334 RepID=UPI0001EFB3B0|nr:hypothetical protein Tsp_07525 [Trichinella spiralis]
MNIIVLIILLAIMIFSFFYKMILSLLKKEVEEKKLSANEVREDLKNSYKSSMTGNGDELKNDVGNDLKTDSTLLLVNSEMFDISISLSDEVIDDEFSIGIKMEDFENSDNNSSGGSESEISIKEKEIELNHQQDKKNLFQAIPSADEKLHKRLSDVDEQGENFNASKAERQKKNLTKNDDSTFQTVQYAESELLRMRKAVTKESSSQNTQKSDATQPVTGKK